MIRRLIARQRAIVQEVRVGAATSDPGQIVRKQTTVQRAKIRAAAEAGGAVRGGIAGQNAIAQCSKTFSTAIEPGFIGNNHATNQLDIRRLTPRATAALFLVRIPG